MRLHTISAILAISLGLAQAVTVDQDVHDELGAEGSVKVLLHFKGPQPNDVFQTYTAIHNPEERSVHPNVFPDMLEANANTQQAQTLDLLRAKKMSKSAGSDYVQLWAYNMIAVRNVDSALLTELMSTGEIERISLDAEFQAIEPIVSSTVNIDSPQISQSGNQWGVDDIQAPGAWQQGYSGQGVVVGVIDTGIRSSHEILKPNFRSSYGWFDAVSGKTEPYDDNGHGSHCAGTIAGINGYGVAPNATLIACKNLNKDGGGSASQALACGQFMLCPTDPSGKNKDCTKAPKVISNSWGFGVTSVPALNQMVDNWINNNQIAIFANGNSGPSCNTAGSPASYRNSIAVGATDIKNALADFSSRGPGEGNTKPNICAPGVNITSAGFKADNEYSTLSGTSMATPHVAGAAAIYCSKDPSLTQFTIFQKMVAGKKSVNLAYQWFWCGYISPDSTPNNYFGHGKIQILGGL